MTRTILLMLLGCFQVASTQVPAGYPQGYFRNPLNVPMLLSGNFGELRPNHYHMGFDLKTLAKENLPVYAAADGFVSRIKIESFGFGRAIYVQHPNGYTTLYAHLNNFNTALENWVKQKQYEQKSWSVYLEVPPALFPVKKGDFLANSGNTGGSQAPHLHFEIRETAQDINVNPALFGFPITDNTRPALLRLAVFDRTRSTYEQNPRIIAVKASAAGVYTSSPALITVSSPRISFAIGAFDTQTGSSSRNGVFESSLVVDQNPLVAFRMDKISYNDTRYLNAHVDYRTREGRSIWLQHLSELPGYTGSIYHKTSGNGVIDIGDGEPHDIRIETKDANGNNTILRFKVQYSAYALNTATAPPGKMFYPNMLDGFESRECEFYVGERCLYDSVHIRYVQSPADSQDVSAIHTIGASYIPLHEAFLVRVKSNRILTPAERSRTVMVAISGGRRSVQKPEWQQEWAGSRWREFGDFSLMIDTEPPAIMPIGFADGANLSRASRIAFTIKDNLGAFKNVRTELDGQWLRFTNDKGRTFIYRFDEHCMAGPHELKISAEDEAGNTTERVFRFIR